MPVDSFSPFAPARVRALVLPLGKIKKSSFVASHGLLTRASEVYLADLCSNERATKSLLSPEAFPAGVIFYDFNTSAPQPSHLNLSPFELFREPTVILGIGDSNEYVADTPNNPYSAHDVRKNEFLTLANDLKDGHSRALVHRVLLFNEPEVERAVNVQDELFLLPLRATEDDMRRVVWDVTASLLVELASYATSVQALPSISSPTVPQHQLMPVQWPEDASERSQSPVVARKDLHRMSMPVFSGPNNSDPALRKAPARTFDEMASNEVAQPPSAVDKFRSRPESVASSREGSQERVSVHGFGSDSFSEKTRNKGRGRVGVVLASVYIQAGRWPDALRESIESAERSRSFNDFIWHAKSLENIALCMVLIAWSGMEFQIPPICYPFSELPSTKQAGADPETGTQLSIKPFASAAAKDTQLKMLSSLFPVLANMILSIFSRATSAASSESVPHVVFSECAIRLARLLAAVNISGGTLTENCLSHLILGTSLEPWSDLSLPRTRIHPSKREVTAILTRAFPGETDPPTLSFIDSTLILAGIASVFSSLGMQRKKALVLKELLAALIPGLLQAKMIGAAEAGVHPLSGLAAIAEASHDEAEGGLEGLLNGVCRIYGIPETNWIRSIASDLDRAELNGTNHLSKELIGSHVLRSFGNPSNKANFLRTCIRLCEALPDYRGILYYSSALLRTAGPGVAPSAETSSLVGLSREEQLQISNDIFKTIGVAKSLGFGNLEAEYWDEFLVRGLYMLDPSGGQTLHYHRKSDLGRGKAETQKGPFIHNPFGDSKDTKWPNLLAAGEVREFVVALQNPYDFEVVIEHLSLQGGGTRLDISKGDLSLKPYRTQSFSVVGSVGTHGIISVGSCLVKVRGCRERTFSIFGETWTPYGDLRIKTIGLPRDKRQSGDFLGSEFLDHSLPSPSVLDLSVIPEQPLLIVEKSSVLQNALMLMEGESDTVSLTVHNASSVPVDFMHVSIFDSTTAAMKEALAQKRITSSEMYEIEYHISQLPAVSLSNAPTAIAPGSYETLDFKILGKPGLSSITFQIDYANIAIPHLSKDDGFFTRQISYSISLTVNASIQVPRIEILPLTNELVWPMEMDTSFGQREEKPTPSTHCFALVDLRNVWPSPLTTTISVLSLPTLQTGNPQTTKDAILASTHIIQPGQTTRHLLLLQRIHIPRPHAPIPTTRSRQFVRSTVRHDPAAERAAREAFWLRRELLLRLRAEWSVVTPSADLGGTKASRHGEKRRGRIDLGPAAAARLPRASAAALRLPDLDLSLSIEPRWCTTTHPRPPAAYQVPVDTLVPVSLRLRNRSARSATAPLVARLRVGVVGSGGEPARHVASGGSAVVVLGALKPGEERSVENVLQACFVEEGSAEVCGWVEEVRAAVGEKRGEGTGEEEKEEVWLGSLEGRRRWVVEGVQIAGVLDESESVDSE